MPFLRVTSFLSLSCSVMVGSAALETYPYIVFMITLIKQACIFLVFNKFEPFISINAIKFLINAVKLEKYFTKEFHKKNAQENNLLSYY